MATCCHLLPFCGHSAALSGQGRGHKLPSGCESAARMLPKSCHLLPFVAKAAGRVASVNILTHKGKLPFTPRDPGKHAFSGMSASGSTLAANRGRQRPATNSMVRDPAPRNGFRAAF